MSIESETRMFRRVRSSQLAQLRPERVCVIKPSALGDVVQTLPLLPVLKQCYPDARLSWVINRELTDLVAGHPCLDETIPFERRGGWRAWSGLLTELSRRRFDVVFDLQGLLRSAVMTAATRAAVRVGLETAREGASLATNCVIPDTSRAVPAHARIWRVAEVLGFGHVERETIVSVSSSDEQWARGVVSTFTRPVVAVHPGARWETKRWPVPQFAELLVRARREWHVGVLILGSPSERTDAEHLHQRLVDSALFDAGSLRNLAGQTTLKQLAALLKQVHVAISNDSGPMHLAAGLGVPTLGLFTCTSAARSGPPGPGHELVSTTVPCAASYCKRCPKSGPQHLACLPELNVDRVWGGLHRLMSGVLSRSDPRAA